MISWFHVPHILPLPADAGRYSCALSEARLRGYLDGLGPRQAGQSAENLFVKTIEVNKGIVMRRFMPKARGRAARYQKTMSHVSLELGTLTSAKPAKKAAKKAKKAE